MEEFGWNYTTIQITNEWNNLKKAYFAEKKRRGSGATGECRGKNLIHFEDFEGIFRINTAAYLWHLLHQSKVKYCSIFSSTEIINLLFIKKLHTILRTFLKYATNVTDYWYIEN